MNTILNNPYRILGLLIGASAREQAKQINKLKKYIDAGQDPSDDFSFPSLGHFARTFESVENAAANLTLDRDKINAALFWFWNGNPITDEVAFDALKDDNTDEAIEIWRRLIYNAEEEINEVSKRNASAFFNLSTLYLNVYGIDEETLQIKLLFLESEYFNVLKNNATDEYFKISTEEIQLLFLNTLTQQEKFDTSEFIDAISNIEFIAKDNFVKGFVQKPIEQIELQVESAKNKRKISKANAAKAGQELVTSTLSDLTQLKSIVGLKDLRYTSLADKVANEILQCSIDFFNESQEKDSNSDYTSIALKLAKQAENLAAGKITKDRIKDSIETLAEMKDKELSQAIQLLQSVKEAYETNKAKINAEVLAIPLRYNQTINWSKVNQRIEKSLDWDKVVELILEVITHKNVEKIKSTNNPPQINEYKSLAEFVISKFSFTQVNKVKYICYWKTESTVSNVEMTVNSLPIWAKWCLGFAIFLIIVGLIWGEKGLEAVFSIAAVLVVFFLIGWLQSLNR
jgi:hypothetical protein